MLVSVHVPKCAGTSFRHAVDAIFGARAWYNYGSIFSREQASRELVPPGTTFIHGHFLADAFDDIVPERRLVTWVRNPVERVASNYHHFLRSPDMRDDCCRILHERNLTLREFADLEWMQNMSTRYQANKSVDDFEFIGIAERFQESMDLFCWMYGFRDPRPLPRANINPDRKADQYDLPPEVAAHIRDRNLSDLGWYQRAVERLDQGYSARSSQVA
ncbi:MAG TPA: hypothetical protein VII09_07065 [Opitutaceae bacterium]